MMRPEPMPIQDEVPLPANPLATLTGDYEHAVLHLAWDRNRSTQARTLLFAWVELLPNEVPPPEDDGEQEIQLGGKSDHAVNVRHAVVTAEQALEWYLACRRGSALLPGSDGRLPGEDDPTARRMRLGDLGEEPPWPNLVCAKHVEDPKTAVPFCPTWHACPRVHHLVPQMDFDLVGLWSKEQEREKATRFLNERMHFEISQYPEYWGSVHLVAPNPVFRTLKRRRQPDSTDRHESKLFRFQPRAEKGLASLELLLQEDRPSGFGAFCRIPVNHPTMRVTFQHESEGYLQQVYDRQRGLLTTGTHATIRGVSFSVAVVDPPRRRIVGGADPHEVPVYQRREGVTAESAYRAPPARARMSAARTARDTRGRAEALNQRWFDERQNDTPHVLRSILQGATRRVLIVDGWFGAAEILRFGLAVSNLDVPVHILTSEGFLESKSRPASTGDATVRKGDALLAELRRVCSHQHVNEITIRVMTGSRSVHDRFFVVDDRVSLLGSSLNEFGSRGTMMVTLPNPDPVREKLFDAWNLAQDLATWVEGPRERRKPSPQGTKQ